MLLAVEKENRMNIRTWSGRLGTLSAAAMLAVAGMSLTTTTSASAAPACMVFSWTSDGGKKAHAENRCAGTGSANLYRKFVWNNGTDSMCLLFRPGQKWTHNRPWPWSTFAGMKSC